MAEKFTKGEIVQLKSGGPDMTVEDYISFVDQYRCQWFGGKKLETGTFPPESLRRVTAAHQKRSE